LRTGVRFSPPPPCFALRASHGAASFIQTNTMYLLDRRAKHALRSSKYESGAGSSTSDQLLPCGLRMAQPPSYKLIPCIYLIAGAKHALRSSKYESGAGSSTSDQLLPCGLRMAQPPLYKLIPCIYLIAGRSMPCVARSMRAEQELDIRSAAALRASHGAASFIQTNTMYFT